MRWRYVKWGTCDFCGDAAALLYTPVADQPLRVVTAPLFCSSCRRRFTQLVPGILTRPVGDWRGLLKRRA